MFARSKPLIVIALLALAGCASDAEIAQRRAIIDDAKCQSYGAKPGEPAYVQCHAQLDAAHTGAEAAAMSGGAAAALSWSLGGAVHQRSEDRSREVLHSPPIFGGRAELGPVMWFRENPGRDPMRKKSVAFGRMASKQVATAPHKMEKGQITPFDITRPGYVGPTVAFQSVSFEYVNVGGTNNLAPGHVDTQTFPLTWPEQASYAIVLFRGFAAAYVDENDDIVDHHLGELLVNMYFPDDNNVACDFLLRDSGISEGVHLIANGWVLYFGE